MGEGPAGRLILSCPLPSDNQKGCTQPSPPASGLMCPFMKGFQLSLFPPPESNDTRRDIAHSKML